MQENKSGFFSEHSVCMCPGQMSVPLFVRVHTKVCKRFKNATSAATSGLLCHEPSSVKFAVALWPRCCNFF